MCKGASERERATTPPPPPFFGDTFWPSWPLVLAELATWPGSGRGFTSSEWEFTTQTGVYHDSVGQLASVGHFGSSRPNSHFGSSRPNSHFGSSRPNSVGHLVSLASWPGLGGGAAKKTRFGSFRLRIYMKRVLPKNETAPNWPIKKKASGATRRALG